VSQGRAGINIYDLLSGLLETARGTVAKFGRLAPVVQIWYRSRDTEVLEVPRDGKADFYSKVASIVAGDDCHWVAQIQTCRFSIADEVVRAVSVSFMGDNIGRIGAVQPYRKRKLEYIFESPIEIGEVQGGLDSGDYIWHHVSDRWTTGQTLATMRKSLEDADTAELEATHAVEYRKPQ
jgi:hypothetical protein